MPHSQSTGQDANTDSLISGRVDRLLPGGSALLRSGQDIFQLSGAFPGEEVCFQADNKRSHGFTQGRLIKIIKPSPLRIEPACPVAEDCGGCVLQSLHPDGHAPVKSEWVRRAFAPHIRNETDWTPSKASAQPFSRRRVRYWQGEDDEGPFLGFRATASHKVIRHPHCMQTLPSIDALRKKLETRLAASVRSVQVTALNDGMHVVLASDAEADAMALPEADDAQWWWQDGAGVTRLLSRPVKRLHDRLPAGSSWLDVEVGPDDFVQAQEEGNIAMLRQIQAWAGEAGRIVDLFAGIGNLSLPLAVLGARVTGAEILPASVRAANRNAARLGLDARYHVADLFGRFDPRPFVGADVLILDPPRKGAKQVCRAMNVLLPQSVIMLHCDVEAGARDANMLASYGYRLQALEAFDLFPYTGHVEAMSFWRR
ncbi:MAG: 23S rRNA methyltransferase [Mariprofundaceae bacterium]